MQTEAGLSLCMARITAAVRFNNNHAACDGETEFAGASGTQNSQEKKTSNVNKTETYHRVGDDGIA